MVVGNLENTEREFYPWEEVNPATLVTVTVCM